MRSTCTSDNHRQLTPPPPQKKLFILKRSFQVCLTFLSPLVPVCPQDFVERLPVRAYTDPRLGRGPLNLATCLLPDDNPTDLGPKGYLAYGRCAVRNLCLVTACLAHEWTSTVTQTTHSRRQPHTCVASWLCGEYCGWHSDLHEVCCHSMDWYCVVYAIPFGYLRVFA
jgi:hypothetical protein